VVRELSSSIFELWGQAIHIIKSPVPLKAFGFMVKSAKIGNTHQFVPI